MIASIFTYGDCDADKVIIISDNYMHCIIGVTCAS